MCENVVLKPLHTLTVPLCFWWGGRYGAVPTFGRLWRKSSLAPTPGSPFIGVTTGMSVTQPCMRAALFPLALWNSGWHLLLLVPLLACSAYCMHLVGHACDARTLPNGPLFCFRTRGLVHPLHGRKWPSAPLSSVDHLTAS